MKPDTVTTAFRHAFGMALAIGLAQEADARFEQAVADYDAGR